MNNSLLFEVYYFSERWSKLRKFCSLSMDIEKSLEMFLYVGTTEDHCYQDLVGVGQDFIAERSRSVDNFTP